MKFTLTLFACMAIMAVQSASIKIEDVTVDKTFLMKQRLFLELLHNVHEPLMFDEWKNDGKELIVDESKYTEYLPEMIKVIDMYKKDRLLPRGEVFTLFNKYHLEQAEGFVMIFYFAKDWETFYNNLIWSRKYLNEGLFVYCVKMSVMHRRDLFGIKLPSIAEIFPEMFFNGKFITDVKDFDMESWKLANMFREGRLLKKSKFEWMDINEEKWSWWEKKWHLLENQHLLREKFSEWQNDPKWMEMMKDMKIFWKNVDYTEDFHNEESKLTYLTEDIDWNMFWYYLNMQYPFWVEGKYMDEMKEYRGELWMFNIQKLLARYYMERLSHGMGEIEQFSWYRPVKTGYNPELIMDNGLGFSIRKNYWEIYSTEEFNMMNLIEDFERRMRDFIDRGEFKHDGKIIDLFKTDMTNMIGNMIQGNADSFDHRFYGYWVAMSHMLLSGGNLDTFSTNNRFLKPNTWLNFETMLRDPLFYMFYKRVTDMLYRYKYHLDPYKHDELLFKGVQIEDIFVDKLVTFFDWVDTDVSSLMDYKLLMKDNKFDWDKMLVARQMRLNHKPFSFNLTVSSDKDQKVVIRTFLGPKFDEFGHKIALNLNRKNFMEIDQFWWDLKSGRNLIKRSSSEFFWTHKDRTTYTELYKKVMFAVDDKWEWKIDMPTCGFADRLILPRGWYEGLPMQWFVMVTPFDESVKEYTWEEQKLWCGKKLDKHPFGYPFDREINEMDFLVPNMFIKEVDIFHMKDVNKDMHKMHMHLAY